MGDGLYYKSQEPFIWDNTLEKRTESWLSDWKKKVNERELLTVACGITGD
jgi:hypothetical protein